MSAEVTEKRLRLAEELLVELSEDETPSVSSLMSLLAHMLQVNQELSRRVEILEESRDLLTEALEVLGNAFFGEKRARAEKKLRKWVEGVDPGG